MKRIRFAILHGLAQSGHGKSILQILRESGIEFTETQLRAATKHLEMLGLIRATRLQLAELTAEVTPFGKEVLYSL